jgi:16S rRNA (guanine966-N2)-methyltransferase
MQMRIITGKFKGHQLIDFNAKHIRPTTDRVKESLFNIIAGHISEGQILDLFAGTGNLGLEAISRDANHVTFVEKNPHSLDIIRKNIAKLKITDSYNIIVKDVITFLAQYEGVAFDVIFADPPFTEEMADEVMTAASQSKAFGIQTVMAIESAKREKIQDSYPNETLLLDRRVFGDKILSFFYRAKVTNQT